MNQTKSNKQTTIDYRLRKAYEAIDNEREPVCEGCGRGDKPLSHSHTISRNRSKQIGKPELIYNGANIEIECFGTNTSCHDIWEGAGIKEQMKLHNFDKKMLFIKKHDPERFAIMSLAIKSVTIGLSG